MSVKIDEKRRKTQTQTLELGQQNNEEPFLSSVTTISEYSEIVESSFRLSVRQIFISKLKDDCRIQFKSANYGKFMEIS